MEPPIWKNPGATLGCHVALALDPGINRTSERNSGTDARGVRQIVPNLHGMNGSRRQILGFHQHGFSWSSWVAIPAWQISHVSGAYIISDWWDPISTLAHQDHPISRVEHQTHLKPTIRSNQFSKTWHLLLTDQEKSPDLGHPSYAGDPPQMCQAALMTRFQTSKSSGEGALEAAKMGEFLALATYQEQGQNQHRDPGDILPTLIRKGV